MAQFTFDDDDNMQILIEVSTPKDQRGGLRDTSRLGDAISKQFVQVSDGVVYQALKLVGRTAHKTGRMIVALRQQEGQPPLEGVELELALKFTGDGDVAIATLGSEANMTIKFTWGKS